MSTLRLVPASGAPIEVNGETAILGREAACDVVVPDASISRRHARIERRGSEWAIVDLKSANGVFLDGSKRDEAVLRPGQRLRLGVIQLAIEIEDDSETAVLKLPSIAELEEPAATQLETDPLAASLPFRVAIAACEGKPGFGELERLRAVLRSAGGRHPRTRVLYRATLEQYPVLFRQLAAATLTDDPESLRAGLARVASGLPGGEATAVQEDVLALADEMAASRGVPAAPSRAHLEAAFRGEAVTPFLRPRTAPPPRPAAAAVAAAAPVAAHPAPPAAALPPLLSPSRVRWWQKGELEATCVGTIDETHDVKTFVFRADHDLLFSYLPGQFLTFDFEIDGRQVKRSYSIGSTPSRPQTISITVKRTPARGPGIPRGLVSNWLHDHVTEGSRVRFRGPNGRFTCADKPCDRILLLSAGSGAVPVMSMARWLLDTHVKSDIVFLHSARTRDDIIYRRELEWMASVYPGFRLIFTLTAPRPADVHHGFSGRLSRAQLEVGVPDYAARKVYLCGPVPFMDCVRGVLEEARFPMESFHWESFGGAAPKPTLEKQAEIVEHAQALKAAGGSSAAHPSPLRAAPPRAVAAEADGVIVFSRSGKEVRCGPKDYILDVAEENGVSIPYSCRSGSCGECKVMKTQGEVFLEADDGLMPGERERGFTLTCVGKARGRVVLEA